MRPDHHEVETRAARPSRTGHRRRQAGRKPQLRYAILEALEPRALLATLPPATPSILPARASSTLGDESSPSIAVSLNNPNKLVAVWTNINDPNRVAPTPLGVTQAAFSTNGGQTWNTFYTANQVADPTTTNPQIPLSIGRDAQVAFDRNDRVYILNSQRNAANTAGALVLDAFDFSGSTPTQIDLTPNAFGNSNILERWTANPLLDATLAVDDTLASFTDPSTGQTVINPGAGNVYVSYVTTDTQPNLFTGTFNPNRIALITSSNGGVSFSTPRFLNAGGNFLNATQRNAAPRASVSQGTADGRVTPGLVNVVWNDFGSGASASPARDFIRAEQVTPGIGNRVTINNQIIFDSPGNNIVVTTDIPITVTAADITAGFTTLSDLDLRLNITHPNLSQLSAVLIPPQASGRNPVTLFGAADLTGANLGILNGVSVGTTFDDSASRNIFDPNNGGTNANANPYIGTYRPRTGSFTNAFSGMTPTLGPNGLLGTWTLRITDNAQDTNALQQVTSASLVFTSQFTTDTTTNTTIGTTFVRGGLNGIGLTTLATQAQAIGPAPVIAADNTLGSFSPFQGRLYVAYVNYIHPTIFGGSNPADNTDIHLAVSDDGGATWTTTRGFFSPLNDDNGSLDGFSEAIIDPLTPRFDGRPQYAPSIAVDQTTGTLVASWYDARFDAARARVSTYIAASIDGGSTFNQQVYVNPDAARVNPITGDLLNNNGGLIDAATGLAVRSGLLGPIGDNQSAGNPVRDAANYGYGRGTSIAAAAGRAFPAWSGNQNFAGVNADGAGASERLDIYVNRVAIGAGPRALYDGITMGPIAPRTETRLTDGSTVNINNQRDADGTPLFDGFVVSFDRPIYFNPTLPVDPLSFGVDDVRVFYRDTTTANATGGAIAVEEIIPLFDPSSPLTLAQQRAFGPSRFFIRTTQRAGVGTYSLQIRPDYTDRIRTANPNGSVRSTGNLADQNANAIPAQPIFNGANPNNIDVFAVPRPIGSTITLFNNPANPNDPRNGMILAPFSTDTLPIVLPGPTLTGVAIPSQPFSTQLADLGVDRVAQGIDLTFDRDMQVATLSAADVLRVTGPAGPITGPFTLRPVYRNATPTSIPDGGPLVSSISVPAGSTNFVIDDLDVNVYIRHPRAADLTLELIGPDGTTIVLAQGLGGAIGRDYRDTTFDDGGTLEDDPLARTKSLTPISQAIPPFTGRYTPAQALSAFQGKTLATPSSNVWQLRVTDSTGGNLPVGEVQQLLGWSITARPQNPTPNVVARSFRLEFFAPDPANPTTTLLPAIQRVSGTYAVTLGTEIFSARGDRIDQDQDAGLDQLRGLDPAGNTVSFLAQSADVPRTITDATIAGPSVSTSSLVVTDDFLVQGLTLSLTINHSRVRDLTAVLITPAGDRITLFSPNTIRVDGANFTLTTFDDAAATFIFDGGPPFFGSFQPEQPLSGAYLDPAGNPRRSAGTYTLEITDSRVGGGTTNALTAWSLSFRKPLIGDGLGEPVADRPHASFRLFNMDPTDPVSSSNWTPVGPAGVNAESPQILQNRWAGRVSAMAVDPSDPSGNTVYVAGASGGIWKTSNFLTNNPAGPTYIPLTDFGPNFSLHISSIAIFPRNGNPDESIIMVATGEGNDAPGFGSNQTSRGIGFLRSPDGGRSWQVVSGPNPQNPRGFVGLTSFKIVIDPTLSTQQQSLMYAALAGTSDNGTTGGLWRSNDSGLTWEKLSVDSIHGTVATDVILDPFSADVATGNLDRLYVAFRGAGVFRGTSRGQNLTLLLGGVGKPLAQDPENPPDSIDVVPAGGSPPAADRIVLAQVRPTGVPRQDLFYKDWLYVAAVEGTSISAVYSTKDRGENWTRILLPITPNDVPSNNNNLPALNIGPNEGLGGNFAISLAVDPDNPHIVYLGGTSLIRVDTTVTADAHNLTLYASTAPASNQVIPLTNGAEAGAVLKPNRFNNGNVRDTFNNVGTNRYINLTRNPVTPLSANATFFVPDIVQFNNTGRNTYWIPFGQFLQGATRVHELLTFVDPISGQSRIVAATDQGIFSGVDSNGSLTTSIGTATVATGTRNGNLQIAQMHYGAVQPTSLAAQIAGALFHGQSWQLDFSQSNPNILTNGNQNWTDIGPSFQGSGTGVATAQVNDSTAGALYEYRWPADGGRFTDFFQVNGVGRTVGLLRGQNDPQWFGLSPVIAPGIRFGNFAVNPINNNQVIISSGEGRLYSTEDQGRTWLEIGVPSVFGGPSLAAYAPALAFGAPEPGVTAPGSLNDFLYVGTLSGRIFVTRTGGGPAGTAWTEISNGLDGSSVLSILTSPNRGTREAYALTRAGVYYIADSTSGATWQPITGNLFSISHKPFGNSQLTENSLVANELHSLVADWRYLLPESPYTPNSPVHPILYAAGNGGVFRSLNNGRTWTPFPNNVTSTADPTDGTAADYGFLPHVRVTDLDLSLGYVNPDNGRPIAANSPNLLVATTFGRGQFAIRLAPVILDTTVRLHPTLPTPGGSDSGVPGIPSTNTDTVTNIVRPYIQGIGEQTAFGNIVRITIFDLTDPTKPRIVGGYDPANPATDIAANYTDDRGEFAIQINAGAFASDGSTDGPKVLGIQAVNSSGTRGNMVRFGFTLDTIAPPAPNTPDLTLASDSGPVNFPNPNDDSFPNFPNNRADNYTNDNTPTFAISGIEPGNIVYLFRDNIRVQTVLNATATTIQITDDALGPVAPGRYRYTVRQVDQAGNQSLDAPDRFLEVVIDTNLPATPTRPALVPDDNTGDPSDNTTANVQPRVSGTMILRTAQPDAEVIPDNLPLVQIIDTNGTVLGQNRVANDGSYLVQFNQQLNPGVYNIRVRSVDRAGNLSNPSQSLTLTIDTSPAPPITLRLDPRDDTGRPDDNITSIKRPRLLGNTGPNLSVQLIDVNGTVTGIPGGPIGAAVLSQPNGLYTLQLPSNLADGLYHLQTRVTNNVGNTSFSNILPLQIDSTPPGGVPDLRLDPASDTGVRGDGRTSLRRPFLSGTTDPNATVEIVGPNGDVLATGTADALGQFRLQLASNLSNGSISLRARSRDVAGNIGGLSAPYLLTIDTTRGDYDADGRADLALFRNESAANLIRFSLRRSTAGPQTTDFGRPGDIPLYSDFDGDGITDLAVFRPSSDTTPGASEWLILGSRTGARSILFGGSGLDLPAPADFDGDGITDLAVFRPNSDLLPGASEWFILGSSSGPLRVQFGKAGDDLPVPADFNGDGRADLAVFRPSSDIVPGAAHWFVALSGGGAINQPFGAADLDLPIEADYDGDGRADLAVFRPTTSQWFLLFSGGGSRAEAFGAPGDFPAPADYDGDGRADLAIFRPTTAQWTLRNSSTSGTSVVPFGVAADIPVLSPLAYRDSRPGTIVSPNRNAGFGAGDVPRFASLAVPSSPSLSTESANRSVATLNLGKQASRLATSKTQAAPARRSLVNQSQDDHATNPPQTSARRSFFAWFQRRRAQGARRPV